MKSVRTPLRGCHSMELINSLAGATTERRSAGGSQGPSSSVRKGVSLHSFPSEERLYHTAEAGKGLSNTRSAACKSYKFPRATLTPEIAVTARQSGTSGRPEDSRGL